MMLVLSWNLFLLALITGPLAFGAAKLYGDLIAVNFILILKFKNFLIVLYRINKKKFKMH